MSARTSYALKLATASYNTVVLTGNAPAGGPSYVVGLDAHCYPFADSPFFSVSSYTFSYDPTITPTSAAVVNLTSENVPPSVTQQPTSTLPTIFYGPSDGVPITWKVTFPLITVNTHTNYTKYFSYGELQLEITRTRNRTASQKYWGYGNTSGWLFPSGLPYTQGYTIS